MVRVLRSLALALALLTLASGVAVAKGQAPTSYALVGAEVFPEGVAFDARSGNFYVSSTHDGSVQRGNLRRPMTAPFIAGSGVAFSAVGVKLRGDQLYVAGGSTGEIRLYNKRTGALLRTFTTGSGGFLNDIAVAPNGDLYVTDSTRPTIWRVPRVSLVAGPATAAQAWLDLTGSPIVYGSGFNLNGIVITPNGRTLVVSQTNVGKLFRISVATKSIVAVDLGGALVHGDGLALRGRTAFAVDNGAVDKIRLTRDLTAGRVLSRTVDPSFASPTSVAIARGRLLIVNSQFDKQGGTPSSPFTVSSIPIP